MILKNYLRSINPQLLSLIQIPLFVLASMRRANGVVFTILISLDKKYSTWVAQMSTTLANQPMIKIVAFVTKDDVAQPDY